MDTKMNDCFIIMPISTTDEFVPQFNGDESHFLHVLDHLFKPAVERAGFRPISPVASGADLIHAEIIRQLESSELVLCDISCVNPNVFFELGIRTAVDKPVALVRDNLTTNIPFDTSIVNFHTYDASLAPWVLETEIERLSGHIVASSERSQGRNPLWHYFGLTTRGAFRPEESPLEAKIDLMMQQLQEVTQTALVQTAIEDPFHLNVEPPPQASEATYAAQVRLALLRAGASVRDESHIDSGVDMIAETPTGAVAVVVKVRRRSPLTLQYVNQAVSDWKPDGTVGLLLVTNAPLSDDVRKFNAKVENRPPVEFVTWNDKRDDGILVRALGRLARR